MERKADILISCLLSVAIFLSFWILYERSKPSIANAQCVQAKGGIFTESGAVCTYPNPYTGGCNCTPDLGFTPTLVFSYFGQDVSMCLR